MTDFPFDTGVRLFEAVLAPTGERVILKEFLPIMKNLAASEIECVHTAIHMISRRMFSMGHPDTPYTYIKPDNTCAQGVPGPLSMGPHQRAGLATPRPARRAPRRLP